MVLRGISYGFHKLCKGTFRKVDSFFFKLKTPALRNLSVNVQSQEKQANNIIKYIDEHTFTLDDILCSEKVNIDEKVDDKILKDIYQMSFFSVPENNEKKKIIEIMSKYLQLVKSIENVDVENVERLVNIRKDKPVRLTLEDGFNEIGTSSKWDVLSLTKNKENNFFVVSKKTHESLQ
ncbi:hypothetical protein PORY_002532 [Pneumocystis oryctolagi]|uniref:Uncharacterized protein n=1 Tax=Pneumocystis oryctolagi TaxID=42067 RepID=A0ACB7CGA0_9ASCO|nr:hypothetical protein PORY_002532 [Pneumocystis oryctolagi]